MDRGGSPQLIKELYVDEFNYGFSEREYTILFMRGGLKGYKAYTQKDIADYFGLSVKRIQQLEDKIILKLIEYKKTGIDDEIIVWDIDEH